MDENYLNIPSRQSIEAYIDTLESYRNDNDPATDYSQTYLTIKKSQIMEQVDARSRLATIENKEAIDALEARLERLEQPTKRLVSVGKQLKSTYFARGWAKCPIYGNGIWLISSASGGSLYISKDNGKTIQNLDPRDRTDCIFTNDFNVYDEQGDSWTDSTGNSPYTIFKACEIAFKNNKFFIYSNMGKLYETVDAHEFTKIDLDSSGQPVGFFMEDNNKLLLVCSNMQIYEYNENEDSWLLLGEANWSINTNGFGRPIKFNNNLYIIDWNDGLSILSDNYLSHTKVQFNSTINSTCYVGDDPDRVYIENNILFVSCAKDVIYTDDGENWNILVLPILPGNRTSSDYTDTTTGIKLTYLESNNCYYGIIRCAGHRDVIGACGIYKWSSLDSTPECISDSTFADYIFNGLSDILNLDGILYCSVEADTYGDYNLFKIIDDVITNTGFHTEYGIRPYTEYGYSPTISQNTFITKMNDRLYIVSGYNCSYREEDIYALEDYTPTGDETNTIVATF